MEDIYKNPIFNSAIDMLFAEVDVSNERLTNLLQKDDIINFFYSILFEFGSNPDDIKTIFENNNPNNNNLNMIFNENSQNLLSSIRPLNFTDEFIKYIHFSINSDEVSHIKICYNTCKRFILNNLSMINYEKIVIIQKFINELCFACPNFFTYNNNINLDNNYNIKRKLILKESFLLFKEYIKSKNKIHLLVLNKNTILDLINKYSSNSHIQLLLLYHIFHHRNLQYEQINCYSQKDFNYDLYKENFYIYCLKQELPSHNNPNQEIYDFKYYNQANYI